MNLFRSLLIPVAGLFLVAHASALTILVGEFPTANSGDATEHVAVRTAINSYNAANNPDLPQIFGAGDDPSLINGWTEFVAKTTSVGPFEGASEHIIDWTAPNTFSSYYVLTKWGQGQANFDHALHFLSAGDVLNYNPGGASAPQGLSHLAIWAVGPGTTVPDSGTSIALLGIAFLSLGLVRRFLR